MFLLSAALAAFEEMKRTAGDRPILVSGTSFGTIAALHIAAHRRVAGVIVHNPPALREMILQNFGWWNLWLLAGPLSTKVPRALDSVANAGAARDPAVFLLSAALAAFEEMKRTAGDRPVSYTRLRLPTIGRL